jgi:hypothetical protein
MANYPRPLCNPFIVCEHAWNALEKCKSGIVIECGVYDGCTSAALNYSLRHSPYFTKQLALDTFEGMPYDGTTQEQKAKFTKGHLATGNKNRTIYELKRLGIGVFAGKVEDTLPVINEAANEFSPSGLQIAFAYLDLDLEVPTRFCVKFLKDKILKGGRIGFHDYDPNPKYALHGIFNVVKENFMKSKEWKEVLRAKQRDNRFAFFERI